MPLTWDGPVWNISMMGLQHALSGAVAWSVLVAVHPPASPVLIAGYAVTAGAALVPDMDHPSATVSRSLGPLTGILCHLVHMVSGGHRRGTHSLIGCATFGIGTAVVVQARPMLWANVVLTVILAVVLAALAHVVPIRSWRQGYGDELLAVIAAGIIAWWPGLDLSALAPAVLIGVLVHVLGDAITRQGVPLFWPISKESFRLAYLRAGGPTERWLLRPIMVLAIPAIPLWEPLRAIVTG